MTMLVQEVVAPVAVLAVVLVSVSVTAAKAGPVAVVLAAGPGSHYPVVASPATAVDHPAAILGRLGLG